MHPGAFTVTCWWISCWPKFFGTGGLLHRRAVNSIWIQSLCSDAYARQVTYFGHRISLGSTLFVVARGVIGKLQIPPQAHLSKGRIMLAILIFLVCAITSNLFPFSCRSAIASNKTPESSPDPSTNQRIGYILSRFALQFLRFNSSF